MKKIEVTLKSLSDQELEMINKYLAIHHSTLSNLVEAELRRYLKLTDSAFRDAGTCPNCHLEYSKKVTTKAISAIEAEKRGIIELGPGVKNLVIESDTQYVFCPECLWQGLPDADHLR